MSDLIWLTERQMQRIEPYFPLSAVPGYRVRMDAANQSVELLFSPEAFAATRLFQLTRLYAELAAGEDIEAELEATWWESLDQMIARMDIISVNCPSTPATFHLLSARRLALMQPTSYIVNTARGDIIDEAALIRCLMDGKIAGAGLDVFENEPNPSKELLSHPKIACTPHIGAATLEAQDRIGEELAQLIIGLA